MECDWNSERHGKTRNTMCRKHGHRQQGADECSPEVEQAVEREVSLWPAPLLEGKKYEDDQQH